MSKDKPKASDGRTVTFQVDAITAAAIRRLEAEAPVGLPRARSYVIRRALVDAAERLDKKVARRAR